MLSWWLSWFTVASISNHSYLQPPKVCQRFILKPETPHIVCMRSIPGIIEESRTEWSSSGLLLTGSSGSGSQHKLSSEGLPSRGGSLEHGKTSADIGPLDLESVLPTSSGKYVYNCSWLFMHLRISVTCKCTNEGATGSDFVDKEDSLSEGHKSVVQQPLQNERDNEMDQELEDTTATSKEGCEYKV